MSATPSQHYAAGVATGRWQADPMQQAVLPALDRIACELRKQQRAKSWLARLFTKAAPTPVHGLYLWGGVGRGKTFLVDLLFETTSGPIRWRSSQPISLPTPGYWCSMSSWSSILATR